MVAVNKKDLHEETAVEALVKPMRRFAKDSYNLVNRCTKPDAKEFKKIALVTTFGFALMGVIGYLVKLVHIPINNILIGN